LDIDRATPETGGDAPLFESCERTTEVLIEKRKLRSAVPLIHELRLRCGQQDDLTTDLQYFMASNALSDRRVVAVLIRRKQQLEACVLFVEHCRFGLGLGLFRGGDGSGEGLVVGPRRFHLQYVHLATQSLLRDWRVHGISLAVNSSLEQCLQVLGPQSKYRMFSERSMGRTLRLESTYQAMLGAMGPRTRRSLAAKRRQLEARAQVLFLPSLEPGQALEAMLRLRRRSRPLRSAGFHRARYTLLRDRGEFFCMGMRLPDGAWLSILSGWRQDRVTHIDLQMNDLHYKKESLSAVMRAYMLEHEIASRQQFINFVGGSSLLLGRYCQPAGPSTDIFLWRPCLRATLAKLVTPRMKQESIYTRVGLLGLLEN